VKTILLVEDHEDNREAFRAILEHYGYDVMEAADGEAGIDMARARHPDLILMDISIPVIDGWEATRVLKEDERTRDIPIVPLTAHAFPADRARAEAFGCAGFLAKPIQPFDVAAEIERILAEEPGSGP
jgi:CheY-like chemotaxis protein